MCLATVDPAVKILLRYRTLPEEYKMFPIVLDYMKPRR
jgi:hypothetical protein